MAVMKTLIGVDIGTQGTKAALFAQTGQCLARAFRASALHRPRPGVVEEDPEQQFSSVCQTIKACLKHAGVDAASVAGIGIDGQMAGVIGVGRDGKHVTAYDSWLDTRCTPYITQMAHEAGEEVLCKTGCSPSINHGPKMLWWMHKRKSVYRKITAFVQPGAYAAMRLCDLTGQQAFIDTTYLHFSGFADNQRNAWDATLCQVFGLNDEKLPRIVRPESIVGEVVPLAARRCGLKPGVRVVAGCGDTAAAFLACGATEQGIGVDVAGTASVFANTTTAFRADQRQRTIGCGQSAVAGLWHPYAYINGGGMNLEWFRNEIAGHGRRTRGRTLRQLDDMAEEIEPTGDLPLFIPHLGGRVCPSQPAIRGVWDGVSWNHSMAHLYRSVLEGVALEYAVYMAILKSLYRTTSWKEVRVTGGGERSAVWNALKADALQLPVRRIAASEGAPVGAALVAGLGVGVFQSLPAEAQRWVTLGECVRPRPQFARYYADRRKRYAALLDDVSRR